MHAVCRSRGSTCRLGTRGTAPGIGVVPSPDRSPDRSTSSKGSAPERLGGRWVVGRPSGTSLHPFCQETEQHWTDRRLDCEYHSGGEPVHPVIVTYDGCRAVAEGSAGCGAAIQEAVYVRSNQTSQFWLWRTINLAWPNEVLSHAARWGHRTKRPATQVSLRLAKRHRAGTQGAMRPWLAQYSALRQGVRLPAAVVPQGQGARERMRERRVAIDVLRKVLTSSCTATIQGLSMFTRYANPVKNSVDIASRASL
jgi:hypothetical protein